MTGRDLQKAMSDINDDFILEASPDQAGARPVPIWRRSSFRVISGLAAASLVLVIGINTFLIRHPDSAKTNAPVTDMDTVSDAFEEKSFEGEAFEGEAFEGKAFEENTFEDTPLNTYEAPASPDLSAPVMESELSTEAISETESETETPEP